MHEEPSGLCLMTPSTPTAHLADRATTSVRSLCNIVEEDVNILEKACLK